MIPSLYHADEEQHWHGFLNQLTPEARAFVEPLADQLLPVLGVPRPFGVCLADGYVRITWRNLPGAELQVTLVNHPSPANWHAKSGEEAMWFAHYLVKGTYDGHPFHSVAEGVEAISQWFAQTKVPA